MSVVFLELGILILLLLINAAFTMCEMALVSVRKTRLQQLAQQGHRNAAAALQLVNSPRRFLSTAQAGVILIWIMAGVYGGAILGDRISAWVAPVTFLTPYAESMSFVLVTFALAFFSIVFGELIPKRIALQQPERIVLSLAHPMLIVSSIVAPFIMFLGKSTELIIKIMGLGHINIDQFVTGEELLSLLQQGTDDGSFDKSDQKIVERAIEFGDQKVNAIMTTRPEIVWLNLDDPAEKNKEKMAQAPHSHFPVIKGNPENVLGVIHIKDICARILLGLPVDLTLALKQPLFIPESTDAAKVLELFQGTGTHFAMVVDEYGMIQGLITLTDILESLVGEMPQSHEEQDLSVIKRDENSWLIDGLINIKEFKEALDVDQIPGEDTGNFHTLAGFVMSQLGKIPRTSDRFEWKTFSIEVIDMDGNRVDKVLVTRKVL